MHCGPPGLSCFESGRDGSRTNSAKGPGRGLVCDLLHALPNPAFCLFVLLLFLGQPFPAAATEHDLCTDAGATAGAPSVTALRSYRAGFNGPVRLALDTQGRLYIADPATGRVVVRSDDGRLQDDRQGLDYPGALAVDDGPGRPYRLYIADSRQGLVTAYAEDWTPLLRLGQGPGEFALPADIAVEAATGRVYVADAGSHSVKVYDADGVLLFAFGAKGEEIGQFQYPVGLFLDETAQEILIADQLNFRIQIFDLEGNFVCRLGDAAGSNPGSIFGLRARLFTMAQSPWVDPEGRILVPDAAEGRVLVTDRLGQVLGEVGTFGRGNAELLLPSDVVLDSHGRLFVAATNTARLEIFGFDAYVDPERFAPARVEITPNPFDHQHPPQRVTALIEVPGYRLAEVDVGSLTANGVSGDPASFQLGDADGDHEPDLTVEFDAAALAATLPAEGTARVLVRGTMATLDLDGWNEIRVTGGIVDGDGDGVLDDVDLCLDTAAGAVVDDGGCSVGQLCPCSGPLPGQSWRDHGAYVTCVSAAARDFANAGLIGQAEIGVFIRGAAQSGCGEGG